MEKQDLIIRQTEEAESEDRQSGETACDNKLKEENTDLNGMEEDKQCKDSIKELSEYLDEESDKKNVYIQYRIYNNHGVMAGNDAQFENIYFKSSSASGEKHYKGSVFKDQSSLAKWLSDNYESYSMALMIATAVFDAFPYTWIIQAAEKLFQIFQHQEEMERTDALIEILKQFEAEICEGELNTYTGKVPVDIVHLQKTEYRGAILKYIWQQYPHLQNNITVWLQSYNTQKSSLMSKRALETMGLLAQWDYYYFLKNIVSKVAKDKTIYTDMMVGQILIMLDGQEDYKKNVYNLLNVWSKDRQIHHLLTSLFVCAQLGDKNDILKNTIECYIQRTLEEIHVGTVSQYQLKLYDFLGVGIRSYTFYRFLIEKLYDRIIGTASLREKRDIYGLFLKLFAIDINQSEPKNGEDVVLIKLCMSNHTAVGQICFLWQMVWQSVYYKKLLYSLMVLYDEKIYKTDSIYSVEKFIDKVMKNIYTKETRIDICNKIHRRRRNE